jgi:HEAT repeat protein
MLQRVFKSGQRSMFNERIQKIMQYKYRMFILFFCAAAICGAAMAQEEAGPPPVRDLDDAFARIRDWESGGDAGPMNFIIDAVMSAQKKPDQREALADRLAGLLAADDTTFDCKRFAASNLQVIGSEKQVPLLAPLLLDEKRSHLIRYAFQATPGAAIDKALIDALPHAGGEVFIGIVNTLAARGNTEVTAQFAQLVSGNAMETAIAAVEALGRLGTEQAAESLRVLKLEAAPEIRWHIADALLRCARNRNKNGDSKTAEAIYDGLYDDDTVAAHVRAGAFHGLAGIRGADALEMAARALTSEETIWQRAGLVAVRSLPGGEKTAHAFADELGNLNPEMQALLIDALADRGDAAVRPQIEERIESDDEGVRIAALQAAGVLGNSGTAFLLARTAAACEGREKNAARAALYVIPAEDVNTELTNRLEEADTPVRAEIIRALAERNCAEAVPAILDETDGPGAVRDEAWRALGMLGKAPELPGMLQKLADADGDESRERAESAVIAVARRAGSDAVAPIENAFEEARDSAMKARLIRILGETGQAEALTVIRKNLEAGDEAVARAALKALADWPDAEVMKDLIAIGKSEAPEEKRAMALEGYIRLVRKSEAGPETKRGQFAQVLEIAPGRGVKRSVLAGLSELKSREALALAEQYLSDPDVNTEAAVAAEQIRKNFYVLTASHNADRAGAAHDNDIGSRWDTGTFQQPGMWFQLDMTGVTKMRGMVLDSSRSPDDYPRGYEVYVFNDENDMGDPVVTGKGESAIINIRFKPHAEGRYIRIVQTGECEDKYWSIHELRILPE